MSAGAKAAAKTVDAVLTYLQHRMPSYPFDAELDGDFVRELVDDFVEVDILEEVKGFRWYYSQRASSLRSIRLALRRWLANAKNRRHATA